MSVVDQLIDRVESLSPDQRQKFIIRLGSHYPDVKGIPGKVLLEFSGSLDSTSAKEMMAAIEHECEHVDEREW